MAEGMNQDQQPIAKREGGSRDGSSRPIPPLKLGRSPVKVQVVVSDAVPPAHPVQIVVSEAGASSRPAGRSVSHSAGGAAARPVVKSIQPARRKARRVKVWVDGLAKRSPVPLTPEQRQQIWRSWGMRLGLVAFVVGLFGFVGGSGWLALQAIVNPGDLAGSSFGRSLQTLKDIESAATKQGLSVGRPFYVSTYPGVAKEAIGAQDVILPVFASKAQAQMVELRVYRQVYQSGKGARFELQDRIAVEGPDEAKAIALLTLDNDAIQGSSRPLDLDQMKLVEGKAPQAGIWLELSGSWGRSGSQVMYGQIVHYDPIRARLHTALNWSSPAMVHPQWKSVTGDAEPELVIDQTIGLEPQFQIYQVKPPQSKADPDQLVAITLEKPAIGSRPYEIALSLAKGGLWSDALARLEAIAANDQSWSTAAQAQLVLVKLHAQVAQAQSQESWASPTQEALALLMDGQWSKALEQLKAARNNGYDVVTVLSANADRIMMRVETSLKVYPGQADVLRWGTLVEAAKKSNWEAIAWLQQRSGSSEAQSVLALLEPLPSESSTASEPSPRSKADSPASASTSASTPGQALVDSNGTIFNLGPMIDSTPAPLPTPAPESVEPAPSPEESPEAAIAPPETAEPANAKPASAESVHAEPIEDATPNLLPDGEPSPSP
ncbi:MAG: hypothetical protein MUF49_26990 [Oculatellaceae cyanobacterium Prado106]|nr:hypothetical protein [Oculatellaceae cyanobacterium Prado106]